MDGNAKKIVSVRSVTEASCCRPAETVDGGIRQQPSACMYDILSSVPKMPVQTKLWMLMNAGTHTVTEEHEHALVPAAREVLGAVPSARCVHTLYIQGLF